jgi:hypothetical protein
MGLSIDFIGGRSPELVLFRQGEDGTYTSEVEETIDLTEYDVRGEPLDETRLEKLHELLMSKGFVRGEIDVQAAADAEFEAMVEAANEASEDDKAMEKARAKARKQANAKHRAEGEVNLLLPSLLPSHLPPPALRPLLLLLLPPPPLSPRPDQSTCRGRDSPR